MNVWDSRKQEEVAMPAEMAAFLADLRTVCEKHGLVIGLNRHDELAVQRLSSTTLAVLMDACKDYN